MSTILRDCNGDELVKDRLYRFMPDGTEYEFGYVGNTGGAVCYIPGERNMQDSVVIEDSTKLQPVEPLHTWDIVYTIQGPGGTMDAPNKPNPVVAGSIKEVLRTLADQLPDDNQNPAVQLEFIGVKVRKVSK